MGVDRYIETVHFADSNKTTAELYGNRAKFYSNTIETAVNARIIKDSSELGSTPLYVIDSGDHHIHCLVYKNGELVKSTKYINYDDVTYVDEGIVLQDENLVNLNQPFIVSENSKDETINGFGYAMEHDEIMPLFHKRYSNVPKDEMQSITELMNGTAASQKLAIAILSRY